jgi:hypothetical protein
MPLNLSNGPLGVSVRIHFEFLGSLAFAQSSTDEYQW